MEIRKAVSGDIPVIMQIYSSARSFMRRSGNPSQWAGVYPAEEDIRLDIEFSRLYVCVEEKDILGVFCFFEGTDPTYVKIYEGSWLNDEPYGTWIIKVEHVTEEEELLDAAAYEAHCEEEE